MEKATNTLPYFEKQHIEHFHKFLYLKIQLYRHLDTHHIFFIYLHFESYYT